MALVDMKMSAEEAKDYASCAPSSSKDLPKYPYGLCINLNDEALKKLGLALPAVGGKLSLNAVVEVVSVRASENLDGTDNSVELQITNMELSTAGDADALFTKSLK